MNSNAISRVAEVVADLSAAADYADLYIQSGISHGVFYEDGRMDTLSSARSDGLGARLISGDNTLYAHTLGTYAADAARVIGQLCGMADIKLPKLDTGSDRLMELEAALPALDVDFLKALDRELRAECSYIRQLSFRYRTSIKSVLIVRGDGVVVPDTRKYTTFAAQVVMERGGQLQTGYEARSLSTAVADFWDGNESALPGEIARTALRRGLLMMDAVPCPAGTMPVALHGSAGGTMIHEACGHGLEADIIQKDFSVYSGMIGKEVAAPIVSIVDDATIPGRYGSYAVDDEGTPAARTVLVENGVLRSYMTDILSAEIGGLPLTGNGRRESYQHQPIPRMSNTYVEAGDSSDEEIIDGVKNGLLVKKMGGGEVDPTSGDFVFFVSEGYIIENGKVGAAVRGATLTGNGPDVLKNITAVGREVCFDPGTCGKSGQGVPVSDGQPTILIGSLTVGGSDVDDGD